MPDTGMSVETIIRNSQCKPISSVEGWLDLAPPAKGELHWKEKRSAYECAHAWFRTGPAALPQEIQKLLESHPSTRGFQVKEAVPEAKTALDSFAGNTRNTDVMAFGCCGKMPTIMAVEAKADEEFGPRIGEYRRSKAGTKSNAPKRISLLSQSVFGKEPDDAIESLRYQLLHGFAAALIEAKDRGAAQAVFVVHEFHSRDTKTEKAQKNHMDLQQFIRVLSRNSMFELECGRLFGPYVVLGGEFVPANIPAYIGKVVVDC